MLLKVVVNMTIFHPRGYEAPGLLSVIIKDVYAVERKTVSVSYMVPGHCLIRKRLQRMTTCDLL